ncbi:EAL domain-containing protein [Dongia sedimenti]|uniref:EAL domain-containing protein n=1 Tax=Dongia sedimenti TaxID=3064282 RepID=A0ABU0YKC6_9PROT|nr:EAL domain-containing protein [Rhodospirillaceae bacterium R-7]
MLVEDNPADTRLVREALAEHPVFTFQVAHFQRIDEALKFLERDVVDVALLDYLPGSDDVGGLAQIVAAAPNLPIVMLTGVEDDATGLRMMQEGAQDYLVKGTVNAAMLVRTIRQAIERKGMSDRVRDSEERFTLAAAGSGDGIWDWQMATDHLFLSPRAGTIIGLTEGESVLSMEAFTRRIHLDDVGRFGDALAAHLKGGTADFRQQARVMVPNEGARWLLMRGLGEPHANGRGRRMAGSITDLSNLDAYYDPFTGLPNRTLLIDRLRSVMKRRPMAGRSSALLLVTLSRYDAVVETMGQVAGDALMTGAARLIEVSARPGDMVARTGVRELAVVLDGIAGADEAMAIAGRACHNLLAPILIDGEGVVPAMRMGVVVTSAAYSDPEAVMHDATAALDTDISEQPYCVFNLEMRERAAERLRIEAALRRAIERDALKLVYQPIVALESGALRGFEALLRWHDPAVGEVPPTVFIPIAENLGLIREIGSWVLRTACCQVVAWRAAGLIAEDSDFTVSVNISGRQLDDAEAIDHLMAVIAETGVPPRHLTLELTESALFANPERAREALMAIKLQGVSLAMDDFGTGYSSLSYLGRFPFDKLKIDRSFVNTIAAGVASPLLKGMLSLCREIGLRVVAEGVETEEQRDVLANLRCQDAQGWLFGRPLELGQAEALLVGMADRPPRNAGGPGIAVPSPDATDERLPIDGVQRRDAVIVAAEIVGYGRMMAHDEGGALYVLADVRRVIDPMIVAYRGRILGIAGESYLLEFDTAADAVSWALALQRAMGERNAEQPEERRMELRVGIGRGSIVVRGYDVSGGGFNIATGLEALAPPGGVCVSDAVYDSTAGSLHLQYEDLGPQQVKNNGEPVRAYRASVAVPA